MIYEKEITVPANTKRNARQRNTMKVSAGILHYVEIFFPPGCSNLVGIQIRIGGHPIFPSTEGQHIAGDTFPVRFNDYVNIKAGNNVITFMTYNENDFYSHTIRVRIGILRAQDLAKINSLFALGGVISGIEGSLGTTKKRRRI